MELVQKGRRLSREVVPLPSYAMREACGRHSPFCLITVRINSGALVLGFGMNSNTPYPDRQDLQGPPKAKCAGVRLGALLGVIG